MVKDDYEQPMFHRKWAINNSQKQSVFKIHKSIKASK